LAFQRRHLHAAVVVEMHMQRRQRQIVVTVEILHQPLRQVACGVIVDIDQGGDALPRRSHVRGVLLQPGAREIADDLGPVLIAARFRRRSISASSSSSMVMVIRCMPNSVLAQYDISIVSSY
jgi:hypothetical protein